MNLSFNYWKKNKKNTLPLVAIGDYRHQGNVLRIEQRPQGVVPCVDQCELMESYKFNMTARQNFSFRQTAK